MLYDRSAPKRPVNVSLNSDLARLARERGVNLSQLLEDSILAALKAESREEFLAQNREGFAAYEHFVAENGVFGDDYRSF